jgi:hypothetical protein
LIVRYGTPATAIGITVTTPGNTVLRYLETKPEGNAAAIEPSASYLLCGLLRMADRVSVAFTGSQFIAEISGISSLSSIERYHHCIGSMAASVVTAVASEALNRPLRIKKETRQGKTSRIVIEVLA